MPNGSIAIHHFTILILFYLPIADTFGVMSLDFKSSTLYFLIYKKEITYLIDVDGYFNAKRRLYIVHLFTVRNNVTRVPM